MTSGLELSYKEFKITMIKMMRALMKEVGNEKRQLCKKKNMELQESKGNTTGQNTVINENCLRWAHW